MSQASKHVDWCLKKGKKEMKIKLLIILIVSFSLVYSHVLGQYGKTLGFENENDVIVTNQIKILVADGSKGIYILNDGSTLKYNHNGKFREFKNLKKGSSITFKDGRLVDFNVIVNEKSFYEIEGWKFEVPADGEVIYKVEEKVIRVTVPPGFKPSKPPEKIDVEKVEIKYIVKEGSEEGMTITESGKEIKVRGTKFTTDNKIQKLEVFYDENGWYTPKAEIGGVEIGLKGDEKRIYIFGDGEKRKDSSNAYFSYNENARKVSFGAPAGHKGIYARFKPGNKIVDIKDELLSFKTLTGEKSHISISHQDVNGLPKILAETEGPFQATNGKFSIAYSPELNLKSPQYWEAKSSEKSVDLEIFSRDSNGDKIKYFVEESGKQVEKTYEKNLFLKNVGENSVAYFMSKDEFKSTDFESKVKYNSLSQEYKNKWAELSSYDPQKATQLLKRPLSEIIYELDNLLPNSNADIKYLGSLKIHDTQQIKFSSSDYTLGIHEGIHFLHSDLNSDYGKPGYYVLYLGDGRFALVKKTGISQPFIGISVPRSLLDGSFRSTMKTYFYILDRNGKIIPSSTYSNRDSTHILEETFAYQIDTKAGFNRAKARLSIGEADGLSNTMDFMIINLVHLQQLEKLNPKYYSSQDGSQFRGILKYSFEEGMKIINNGYTDNRLSAFRKETIVNDEPSSVIGRLNNLRTNQDARHLRETAIKNYGIQWTQQVFGFSYVDGSKNKNSAMMN